MDVLILAGSDKDSELTQHENVENKAFIKLKDKYIISYIIEAMQRTEAVERIAVVAPPSALGILNKSYHIIPIVQKGALLANVQEGFKVLAPKGLFLVTTGDIPLITPEAVNDFLEKSRAVESDFYYPVVERKSCEAAYPGVERTFVRLKEGYFTGGNLFFVNAPVVEQLLSRVEVFFKYRKNPLKLAFLFGWLTIIKYFIGQLSVADLEKRFSVLFGIRAKAIVSNFAAIATDIDKLSDLELVRLIMAREQN
ncbi:MAG: NTP transferase domain-containing protein [Dethiobacteria bacterium]